MSMMSESEEKIALRNGTDCPPVDDANSGGYEGGNSQLKKGPWTAAEDAILVEYVTKNGEGNWNAVQKHSGLARCGKSCRLRWANHLRPDLKKGAFTQEEENLVVELHAKMGNKWARMAAEMPGRTDNEIKNFWNTRTKRRERAGLPIYPPEICSQVNNENQQNEMSTFSSESSQHLGFMSSNFEIPPLEFKNLELKQEFYPPSSLLAKTLNPSYLSKSVISVVHPAKRLKSEPLLPGLTGNFGNFMPCGSPYQNTPPFIMLSSTYEHNTASTHAPTVVSGIHSSLNSNLSTSHPAWDMKRELPSFQTFPMGSWGGSPSSPLPSPDSVDILIQSPPIEQTQSCNLSPRDSGLLEAVLYESKTMTNSSVFDAHDLHASDMAIHKMHESPHLHETEWEDFGGSISPLCHSPASVFSDRNVLYEHQLAETRPGCKHGAASTCIIPMQSGEDAAVSQQSAFTRPDMLLGSNCLGPINNAEDEAMFKDAVGALKCDDLNTDCKQRDTTGSSPAQGYVHHDPCAWNAMSSV